MTTPKTPQDFDLSAMMAAEHIRTITRNPAWHSAPFAVYLDCGGPAGVGDTVGEALADAKAKNAEYLEMWA